MVNLANRSGNLIWATILGELRNLSTLAGVLNGDAANAAIFVDVDKCSFVKVARLGDLGGAKLDVQRVGVLEVLNPHGVKERSKDAL